jgi:hypothetical protein
MKILPTNSITNGRLRIIQNFNRPILVEYRRNSRAVPIQYSMNAIRPGINLSRKKVCNIGSLFWLLDCKFVEPSGSSDIMCGSSIRPSPSLSRKNAVCVPSSIAHVIATTAKVKPNSSTVKSRFPLYHNRNL